MSTGLLAILCGAFLGLLLYAESSENDRLRYLFKPLASACFIAVAVLGGALDAAPAYGRLIVIGLMFGAAGDVLLMLRGQRCFLSGLVAFLAGHLCYVAAFTRVAPLSSWATPYALLPLIAAAASVLWLWRHLGRMRLPVLVYVAVIASMMIGAIAVLEAGDGRWMMDGGQALKLFAGASFFFASDLAVARQRFIAPSFANQLWGLPAYYLGQMLLALSAIR
ncbi:MAG: lysoplasmalogenase [Myxococcota bacterium]